jgi:hypothetical protein
MRDVPDNPICPNDDEVIELHAMGRLQDAGLRHHLDTCTSCSTRVTERRQWIADLNQALRAGRDAESAAKPRRKTVIPIRPEDK